MNELDASKVLRLIGRPHNVTPDPDLLESWYNSSLQHVDFELGLSIARELTQHFDRMPKPAQFNEFKRQRLAKQKLHTNFAGELEESWSDEETFRRGVNAAREALGARSTTAGVDDRGDSTQVVDDSGRNPEERSSVL